jgi:hypothetical protein
MVSDAHTIGMNKNQSRGLRRLFNIERIRLIRAGIIRLIPLLMHERLCPRMESFAKAAMHRKKRAGSRMIELTGYGASIWPVLLMDSALVA